MADDPGDFASLLAKELGLLQDRIVHLHTARLHAEQQEIRTDSEKWKIHHPDDNAKPAETQPSTDAGIDDSDVILSEKEPVPEELQANIPATAATSSPESRASLPNENSVLPTDLEGEQLTRKERRWAKFVYKFLTGEAASLSRSQDTMKEKSCTWDLQPVWSLRTNLADSASKRLLLPGSMRARRAQCASLHLGSAIAMTRILDSRHGDLLESNTCLRRLTVDPDSKRWSFWTFFGVLVLIADFFVIPLEVAGLVDQIPFAASICAAIYWTLDMPFSFITGYHIDGLVEMRPSMTIINYGKSWFLPDLLILFLDIVYLSSNVEALDKSSTNSGSFLRIFRMFRILRFCRARKIYILYKALFNRVFSVYMVLTIKLLALIAFMLMLTHWVACIWYAISSRVEGDETWSDAFGPGRWDRLFNYILALHWALCQFAPATTNIAAQNIYERGFADFIAVLSLIVFSSFISNVTNAVNQLKSATMSKMSEHTRMREFFLRMHVSSDLGHRIQRFFNHNYHSFACPVREMDIKAFHDLPETLKIRLHDEIYLPMLHKHEVFEFYGHYSRQTLSRICHYAFTENFHYADQDMFIEATECNKMRFLLKGKAEYYGPCGSVFLESRSQNNLSASPWISDVALWLVWEHAGRLTAHSSCQVVALDCDVIRTLMFKSSSAMFKAFKIYAVLFLSFVEDLAEAGDRPLTDVPIDKDDVSNIMQRVERFMHAGGMWDMENKINSLPKERTFGSVCRRVLAPSLGFSGLLNRVSWSSAAPDKDLRRNQGSLVSDVSTFSYVLGSECGTTDANEFRTLIAQTSVKEDTPTNGNGSATIDVPTTTTTDGDLVGSDSQTAADEASAAPGHSIE